MCGSRSLGTTFNAAHTASEVMPWGAAASSFTSCFSSGTLEASPTAPSSFFTFFFFGSTLVLEAAAALAAASIGSPSSAAVAAFLLSGLLIAPDSRSDGRTNDKAGRRCVRTRFGLLLATRSLCRSKSVWQRGTGRKVADS